MKKVAMALLAALIAAPAAFGQSFNGAGRMNPNSPTGWGANPISNPNAVNNMYGNPYMNPYQNPYGAYPGAGMYNPNNGMVMPGAPMVYPFGTPYVNPVAMGNGLYTFNGSGLSANLWRAPSGYYYPWGVGTSSYNQTIYVNQTGGRNQAVAQQPPLSMQFTDMNAFLDDAFKNGKLSEGDYRSMKQRLKDIQKKERSYRIQGDGFLEDSLDAEIRQDLKDFAKLMTERIKL